MNKVPLRHFLKFRVGDQELKLITPDCRPTAGSRQESRQTVVAPVFKVQQERRQKLKFFGKCVPVMRNIPVLY